MPKDDHGKQELSATKLAAYQRRQSEHIQYLPVGVRAQQRQAAMARRHRNLKPMRFVSLHHHSTFSFLDGFQLPEAHVRRATEINMGALAITEHGNIFSHVRHEKAAVEQGVKPIFGCEIYMGWTDEKRRDQKKNHLTVIAKNEQGYRNLLTIITRSWREGFYYEPTVDPRWLVEHQAGLIILSGCQGSALFTAIAGGKHVAEEDAGYRRGLRVARWFAQRFDDYYIEVQGFPELEKTVRANPILARIARVVKRPLVATMDCHYTAPEEVEIQKVLHNVRPGERRTVEDMVRDWGYEVPLCPPPTDMALYRRLRATGLDKSQAIEAIVSTEEIAQECNVELPRLSPVEYPLPEGYDTARALWRDWLREGWRYRSCPELSPRELRRYKAQLAREMEVIEAKGYIGYFLIVSDAVRFAKDNQIPVGPARGSAAGSLACWLLRITEVNPMLYPDLIFERFIDWNRDDMPDIDLDFATYGIPQVREYMEEKYGEDCVNSVGTFTMYKPKAAIDDAARVHKVPAFETKKLKELLLERSSGDLRASASIEDTLDQFEEARSVVEKHPGLRHAMDLEGNVKGFGIHAAGLVVSNGPITDVCAVLEREVNGYTRQVVSMDKYDAKRQGLEKLDFLSLSTMDMIAEVLRQLDRTIEELYSIPLDDERTIQAFRDNDVTGVFQFDGRATQIVNRALMPDNFDEVAITNALSRPGPLHNGAAAHYIGIKWGQLDPEPDKIHPALTAITENTNYQIVFQEQILRIVREIGDFEWTQASYIRKIISQKMGDQEFNRSKGTFLKGAAKIQDRTDHPPMDKVTAEEIWGLCITAGSYAFNAAHSYSYGMLAFWTMYLKQHHPAAFYAACLSKLPRGAGSGSAADRPHGGQAGASGIQTDRHLALMRDAAKHGIAVLPPDAEAGVSWRAVGDKTLIAGWEQVPGVGPKVAEKIVAYEGDDITEIHGVGPKTADRIAVFQNARDPFGIYAAKEKIDRVRAMISSGELDGLPQPTHTAQQIFDEESGRVVFVGFPHHRNLRDIYEANISRTGEPLDPAKVKNPELSEWMMLRCDDEEGHLASFAFPRQIFPAFREALFKLRLEQDVVLISGRKAGSKTRGTAAMNKTELVYADELVVIDLDD